MELHIDGLFNFVGVGGEEKSEAGPFLEQTAQSCVDGAGFSLEVLLDELGSDVLVTVIAEILVGEGVWEILLVEVAQLDQKKGTLPGLLFIQII